MFFYHRIVDANGSSNGKNVIKKNTYTKLLYKVPKKSATKPTTNGFKWNMVKI